MPKPLPLPPYELLHERYEYVDGILLYKKRVSNNIQIGDRVGSYLSTSRYRAIGIGGVNYLEHRIIWKMIHGVDPQGEIDHIDRDRVNNRIENLRDVDRVGNLVNRECVENNGGVLRYTDENGKRVYTPLALKLQRERYHRNKHINII